MDRMLYGPAGYYSSGTAQSGKGGDYFTAPDVGPAMGRLLTEIFLEWKAKLKADDFCLIEAGAGEGRLAQDILALHPFHYLAIERSLARRKQLEKIQEQSPSFEVYPDLGKLKGKPLSGVLFGNELIDAFPVHRVRWNQGKLQELFVSEDSPAHPRFIWGIPSTPELAAYFERLAITLPDDYETEVNLAMPDWLAEAAGVLEKGLVVLIDYGRPAHEYYAPERTRGTLRAFSKHKVSADFLDPAGSVDLTADVDFTSLALDARRAGFTPLAFMEMGSFLMRGAELLLQKNVSSPLAGEDEGGGVKKMSMAPHPAPSPTGGEGINRGLRYLLHPEGLGGAFHVLILGKNIDPAEWVFEHNRLARLGL